MGMKYKYDECYHIQLIYAVTKFLLPTPDDIKIRIIDFDISCNYLTKHYTFLC